MSLEKTSGKTSHHLFSDLPSLLKRGDAIVINDTRVVPARIIGKTASGMKIEFLLVEREGSLVTGMVRGLKKLKPGDSLDFGRNLAGEFVERAGDMGVIRFNMEGNELTDWLQKNGGTPLPPYIDRPPEPIDRERYQTVYAKRDGSCAAPTAGLHFTPELIERLQESGISIHRICLHVGPGTFRPITSDDISNHKVDAEKVEVSQSCYEKLIETKSRGGRVVAVGTTTTRALESAVLKGGGISEKTGLFIYPGFEFKMVDALVTNFHLPKSSLLALVSAFAGRERTLAAYAEAVKREYRFYSYGDAMLIL